MRTYYSSSKYANYTHIHMYVFYDYFINELKKANLDSKEACSVNVDIDGNIAIWKISANVPQADYILNKIMEQPDYINNKNTKKAVKRIAEKINKKFEIIDLNLLVSEISKIKLVDKKPNIEDNDALFAPAVKFM